MYPSILLSVCFIFELLGVFRLNLVLGCLQVELLAVDFNNSWYCPNLHGVEAALSQMADSPRNFV